MLEASQPGSAPELISRNGKLAFFALSACALAAALGAIAYRGMVTEPALEVRGLEITPQSFEAPAFALADARGTRLSLSDYRGKVVFLNFWASWCAPCRDEMPDMAQLAVEMAGHPDFVMLAVSVDDGWQPVQRFFEAAFGRTPPPFAVLLDQGAKVSESYGTNKFPETYVIGRGGRVLAKFIGAREWNTPAAKRYLESLL